MKSRLLILSLLLFSTGCATGFSVRNADEEKVTNQRALDLIGEDLMFVMEQILEPRRTTLQYSVGDSYFGEMICQSFNQRGYGLQKVTADQGANYLYHEESVSTEDSGKKRYLYKISVGRVSVEREYIDNGLRGIEPASPVIVRGSAQQANPNVELFLLPAEKQSEIQRVVNQGNLAPLATIPRISYITDELLSDIATGDDLLPEEVATNSSNIAIKNLFFTNESNFAEVTASYDVVRRSIIVFANDSVRLGNRGKRKVRDIFKNYNQVTDVISLLGCSNGYTDLAIGNQGLALGRSKRVFEEFRDLGVPRSALLDEGCWSPERLDGRYPRRGVIVELKRRSS